MFQTPYTPMCEQQPRVNINVPVFVILPVVEFHLEKPLVHYLVVLLAAVVSPLFIGSAQFLHIDQPWVRSVFAY